MPSQDTVRNILLEIRLLLRLLLLLLISLPASYLYGIPKVREDWFGLIVILGFIIWPLWLFLTWLVNRYVNGWSQFEQYAIGTITEPRPIE